MSRKFVCLVGLVSILGVFAFESANAEEGAAFERHEQPMSFQDAAFLFYSDVVQAEAARVGGGISLIQEKLLLDEAAAARYATHISSALRLYYSKVGRVVTDICARREAFIRPEQVANALADISRNESLFREQMVQSADGVLGDVDKFVSNEIFAHVARNAKTVTADYSDYMRVTGASPQSMIARLCDKTP